MKKQGQITFCRDLFSLEYGKALPNVFRTATGRCPVYGANGIKDRTNEYLYDKPTLIIGRKGSAGEINIAETKFWPLDVTYYVKFNTQDLDLHYLYYLLKNQNLPSLAKGVKPGLNREDVYNISVLVRPLPEQKKIAERLDKVQKLISKQKEQIAKLDSLIKSRFLDMFGDPVSNPKEWRKEKIFDVIETNIIKVKSKYTGDDTIKYIDISSIDNITNTIRGFATYLVKKAPSRAQQCLLKDDILISTVRPNLRNIAINNRTDCNLVASSGFCVLRSTACNPTWLFEIIKSNEFTSYLSNLTTGASYPAVKDRDVYNYLFPCPPIDLQSQFANFVKSVEQQKEVFSTRLSHLETLYKSLMQEYFG